MTNLNQPFNKIVVKAISLNPFRARKIKIGKRRIMSVNKLLNACTLRSRNRKLILDDSKESLPKVVSSGTLNTLDSLSTTDEIPNLCEVSFFSYEDNENHVPNYIGNTSSSTISCDEIKHDEFSEPLHEQENTLQKSSLPTTKEIWQKFYCGTQECHYWYNQVTQESTWKDPHENDRSTEVEIAQQDKLADNTFDAEVLDFTPRRRRHPFRSLDSDGISLENKLDAITTVSNEHAPRWGDKDDDMKAMWILLARRRKQRLVDKQNMEKLGTMNKKKSKYRQNTKIVVLLSAVTIICLTQSLTKGFYDVNESQGHKGEYFYNETNLGVCRAMDYLEHIEFLNVELGDFHE